MNEQNRTVEDTVDSDDLDRIKEEISAEPDVVNFKANRTPKKISSKIKDLANEEFAGDYGMALTFLWKEHESKQELEDRIERLQKRQDLLEEKFRSVVDLGSEKQDEDDEDDENELRTLN